MYSGKQRGIALLYGVFCHAAFALGIAAMMLGLYTGLEVGRGTITGIAGGLVDVVLVLQFVVIHSFLLSARGRALLARFASRRSGSDANSAPRRSRQSHRCSCCSPSAPGHRSGPCGGSRTVRCASR